MVLVRFCVDWKSIGRAKWSRLSLVMDGRRRARTEQRPRGNTRFGNGINWICDRPSRGKGRDRKTEEGSPPIPIPPQIRLAPQLHDTLLLRTRATRRPSWNTTKQWKKEQVWQFFGCCTADSQAEISCTIMARLFFSPLLEHNTFILESLASTSHSSRAASKSGRGRHFPRSLFHPLAVANLASRAARSDPTPLPTPSLNSG